MLIDEQLVQTEITLLSCMFVLSVNEIGYLEFIALSLFTYTKLFNVFISSVSFLLFSILIAWMCSISFFYINEMIAEVVS